MNANTIKLLLARSAITISALAAGFFITSASAEDNVSLSFVNADIPSVVKTIGGHTGKTFIIDPRVTGTMNIISQNPVSKEIAYQILLSALRVHGFAAIEERGMVKIVPEADAKTSGTVIDRSKIGRAHV